jgi:hypothetical protein
LLKVFKYTQVYFVVKDANNIWTNFHLLHSEILENYLTVHPVFVVLKSPQVKLYYHRL